MLKFSTLLALIGCVLSSPVSATEENRPNILFVMSDQHNAHFMGVAGPCGG